jgi:hypothetical protein
MTAKTGSQRRVAAPFGWRTVTPLVMGSALNPVNSSVIATGLVLLPMGAVAALVSHPVSRRNLVRGPLIACAFFMLLASVATLFITGHSPVIALIGSIASATITSIVFHARVSDAGLHDLALILVGVAAVVLLMTLLDRQLPRGSKA